MQPAGLGDPIGAAKTSELQTSPNWGPSGNPRNISDLGGRLENCSGRGREMGLLAVRNDWVSDGLCRPHSTTPPKSDELSKIQNYTIGSHYTYQCFILVFYDKTRT